MAAMDRSTVLVVDDDAIVRTVLRESLGALGHRVVTAEGGHEALELFRAQKPDLVLCDLRMPHYDGWHVLEEVRRLSPETPVLVVSGSDSIQDAIRALHAGAFDYLLKPIQDPAVLEHAVGRALERAQLVRENRRNRAHLETVNRELEATLQTIREDEKAARRVQFHLMPPVEDRTGPLAFSRWVLPSRSLSGDFVDWFRIDERRVGFYMADVSGHGVSSAFVTLLVHGFFGRLVEAHREGRDDTVTRPAASLTRLNQYILARKLEKHVTVFYGIVDHERGNLVFSNAGQFPHPILHDGLRARFLEMNGFAVGHFDFAEYSESRWALPERFALVLVSDGILEVLPAERLQDKEAALLRLVPRPDVTIGSMMAASGLEGDRALPDDVTFLVLRGEARRG